MIFLYKKFIRKSKSLMNFLIIDVSYFNFWRFFATKLWYTKAHEDEQIEQGYDWTQNQVFMEKYKKMYFQTLKKYIKKFKPHKIILARDCKRQTIWRMNFYPEYKGTRDEIYEKKQFMGGKVFKYTYSDIIPELLKDPLFQQIKLDNAEADDIIYMCSQKIRKNPDNIISIISSDHDLLQIIDSSFNIKLYQGNLKTYNNKAKGNADISNFLKAILGDSSDNIPKVFSGVGEKTAVKLYNNPNLLLDKFRKNKESFNRYIINRLLVDFKYIPLEIHAELDKVFTV